MATPVLADLRSHFPNAQITVMCQGGTASLLEQDPHINEILSYKKPSGWIHRARNFEMIEELRKGEYDLGVLLTNSFSSAWWFWRGRVRNRLGFSAHWRKPLLNRAVPFPENLETQHLVLTYKALLKPLGIEISNSPPRLYLSEKEINKGKEFLKKFHIVLGKERVIGINPGAAYGSAKCWLPERFIEVTRKLVENPELHILYFGDNLGAPLVNQICQHFPSRVVNLAGKTTIRELMALIKCCNAFLTNDSGPMHIAAALGTPLLALFGSTNEVKTGPYPKGRVIHKHVECSPCYKRVCPIDFRCMKRIEADEVYNELMSVLEDSGQDTSF